MDLLSMWFWVFFHNITNDVQKVHYHHHSLFFAAFQCHKNSCFWFRKPCQAVGKREGQCKHKKQRGILGRIRGKSIYLAQSTEEKFSIFGRSQHLIYEFWTFRFYFQPRCNLIEISCSGSKNASLCFLKELTKCTSLP